jgi:predicted Holliday junction resolvase-like endonuclease
MTLSATNLIEPSVIFQCFQIVVILALFVFALWVLVYKVPERLRQINRKYARDLEEIDERFEKYLEKK